MNARGYVAAKAITTELELSNIILLRLPVHLWDVDMDTIIQAWPSQITQSRAGKLVFYNSDTGRQYSGYMRWFNILDESFTLEEHSMFGQYMFNSEQDAEQARERYSLNIKKSLFT